MKQIATLIVFAILFAVNAYAQCPTIYQYNQGNGGANSCPNVGGTAYDTTDFGGGPYSTVPVTTKQGSFFTQWGNSQPGVTPAIDGFYENSTLLTIKAGPAGEDVLQGQNWENKYCFYGSSNLPNKNAISVIFVDPQTGSTLFSCAYALSTGGGQNSTTTPIAQPTISSQPQSDTIWAGQNATFSVTASPQNGGSLTYQWQKFIAGEWTNIAVNGTASTYNLSTALVTDSGRYRVLVIENAGANNAAITISTDVSLTVYSCCRWTGTTDTLWGSGTNWNNGLTPSPSDIIYIDSTANQPYINGSVSLGGVVLAPGARVTVDGGTLSISGDLTTEGGTIQARTGTIEMNGTTAQTIRGEIFEGDTIQNLIINNTAGVTLDDTVNLTGILTPTSGTLNTNNQLRVINNESGCGCIGAGSSLGGYISDTVIMERFVPEGRRVFRFLTHPFSSSISLSALLDDVDITGKNPADSGFTATKTTNPSAFWYDVDAADTVTAGNNSGWTAFTSTLRNEWDRYETIRILVRGAVGQGLLGQPYTPSKSTLDLDAEVNQGTQVITLRRGTESEFVLSGNPFPCAIQMDSVDIGADVNENFTVWDATQGVRGGYTSVPFNSDYVLPPYGSFVAIVAANTDNTITIRETAKTGTEGVGLFKGTSSKKGYNVQLRIYDSTTFWDRILITFDDKAMKVEDRMDAIKLYNPGMDFFTISSDTTRLSIDARPYEDGDVIQLGHFAWDRFTDYTIKVPDYDVPQGVQLYLEDKYLNKTEPIKQGFEYKFSVNADTNTQGIHRFVIRTSGTPVNSVAEVGNSVSSNIQIVPNPTINGKVKVSYSDVDGEGTVSVISITGQVMQQVNIEEGTGSVLLSVDELPVGAYIIEVAGNNARYTSKLIKK